nr:hypothetical protein [uncultured Aminipila sp.]
MSNKNNRVKRLEKIVKKDITILEDAVLELNEENSQLRNQIDQQNDYIKEQAKANREVLTEHYQYQKYLEHRITDESLIRRQNDNKLRAEIADIEPVPRNWISRLFFK